MEFLASPELASQLTALGKVLMIDLVLAGDNAVAVGLAAAALPAHGHDRELDNFTDTRIECLLRQDQIHVVTPSLRSRLASRRLCSQEMIWLVFSARHRSKRVGLCTTSAW